MDPEKGVVPCERSAWTRTGLRECVGTADEHTDTFYRHGDWGIEEHNEHEFNVYAVVNGTPVPVMEGLTSFEGCVEYIRGASGARELTDEEAMEHGHDKEVRIVMKPFRQMMEDVMKAQNNVVTGADYPASTASLGEITNEYSDKEYLRVTGETPAGEMETHYPPGVGGKSAEVRPDPGAATRGFTPYDPEVGGAVVRDDTHKVRGMPSGLEAQGGGNLGRPINTAPRPQHRNAKLVTGEDGQQYVLHEETMHPATAEDIASADENGMVYFPTAQSEMLAQGGTAQEGIEATRAAHPKVRSQPAAEPATQSSDSRVASGLVSLLPPEFQSMMGDPEVLARAMAGSPGVKEAFKRYMMNPDNRTEFNVLANRVAGNKALTPGNKEIPDTTTASDSGVASVIYAFQQLMDSDPKYFQGMNTLGADFIMADKRKVTQDNLGSDPDDPTLVGRPAPREKVMPSDQAETLEGRKAVEGMSEEEKNAYWKEQGMAANAKEAENRAKREAAKQAMSDSQRNAIKQRAAKVQAEMDTKAARGEAQSDPTMEYDRVMDNYVNNRILVLRNRGNKRIPSQQELRAVFMAQYPKAGFIRGEYQFPEHLTKSQVSKSFRELMEDESMAKTLEGLPSGFGDRRRITPMRELYRTTVIGEGKQAIESVMDPHRRRD